MVAFIDQHRDVFGVEPICRVLTEHGCTIAPSTYYAAKGRPASVRAERHARLLPILLNLWVANYRVYGVRKLWKAARRAGHAVGRDQVARLMAELGIRGVRRGRRVFTTRPDPAAARPADLVQRRFVADGPNQLWVFDLTYVATWSGVAYVCFIVDAFSRTIVGWRVAGHMRTDMVLDAVEMASWSRGTWLEGLVAHSDAGSQFTSLRYGERLAELGAVPSIGSVGDSFDNALAESTIGLYKTELIRGPGQGPWKTVDDVELATLGWVHWHNSIRLHGYLGDVPPNEFEAAFYAAQQTDPAGVGIQ
jgi:putative transposase